jgi:hypothetical protein
MLLFELISDMSVCGYFKIIQDHGCSQFPEQRSYWSPEIGENIAISI